MMSENERKLLVAVADCVNICMELHESRLRHEGDSPMTAKLLQGRRHELVETQCELETNP